MTRICLPLVLLGLGVGSAAAQDEASFPPQQAPGEMSLPEGFQATLFAGEPDVVQPIAFTFDDRGRLWVVECVTYPNWLPPGETGNDRIVIFEDNNADGRFDKKTVFWDKGTNLTGIELGFGGVWLCATPYLLFLPDRDHDDRPDGEPVVLLDGWDLKCKHNAFAALNWGPDGWLYGCNGILSNSNVGRPGTPDEQRTPLNCGVWRYHPVRETFEVVANGTTNPWGLDFNDFGQMFITNCVIKHLWHVVPGAHFKRMHGQDFNPYLYELMESCADHIHWAGGAWQSSRGGMGEHDKPGGGHAHVGAMVYLGDNWPLEYRNSLLTCNVHGNRVNHDLLEPHRSSYIARHGRDFLLANDAWFRGIAVKYGPDGGVFVTDWNDTGECHDYDEVTVDTGRIYKVTYGTVGSAPVDVAALSDEELVALQLHRNDWYVRHARRELQERAAAGTLGAGVADALRELLARQPNETRQLRALWSLWAIDAVDEPLLLELLESRHSHVRHWAVRLELEDREASLEMRERLAELAESDPAPVVRLALASGLQRLPLEERWSIADGLVKRAEDADDPMLSLMIWYGIEPLVASDRTRILKLVVNTEIPLIRKLIARRISEQVE